MKLSDQIRKSEEKYLRILEDYFTEIWGGTQLWSHDLSHHRRVWSFAKELMLCTDIQFVTEKKNFSDKVIIACYLHDLGMSVNTGSKHGVQSRKFCEQFLLKNDLKKSDFNDVLIAIENHDKKDYNTPENKISVLLTLNAADDLDAFGHLGLLRYADIYLRRGASLEDLGNMILENAGKRFENFEIVFHKYPALVGKHRKRYLVISEFCTSYNRH